MESFPAQLGSRWRDYSRDSFHGDVFTLTVRDGGYLIAGLSTFVGFVGPAVWSITAFTLHQLRARKGPSGDGVYFQSQVILKHPSSAISAVKDFILICWCWRRENRIPRVQKLKRRSLVLSVFPILIFAAFTIAGVFVSRVAAKAYNSNDILIKPKQCGLWAYELDSIAGFAAQQGKNAKDTSNARAYARDCYQTNISLAMCSLYAQPNISYDRTDVDCPFGPDPLGENACLYGNNQALQLDTGFINSNTVFGINTARENQLEVKKVTTCSPLHASNYVNQSLEAPEAGGYVIWDFYLGGLKIPGAASGATFSYNTHQKQDRVGFQLYSVYTLNNNSWQPVPALRVPNSDISAYFLSQNAIRYEQPVSDIWFSANKAVQESGRDQYESDQATNVLVCAEQFQLRTPTGEETVLGSYLDLARTFRQAGFNAYQEAIASRLILAIQLASNFNTVTFLGPSALLASDNLIEFVGTTLPADQWKREVEGWFQTSLARIQSFLVEWAAKSEDLGPFGYVVAPDKTSSNEVDKAEVDLCSRQRVRNTGGYQTFSLAGVLITVCVGLCFIIISWILDWAVGFVRSHRKSKHPWRETARIADNKLQLLRKNLVVSRGDSSASEADLNDPWDDIEDSMPIAEPGVKFLIPQHKDGDYYYDVVTQLGPLQIGSTQSDNEVEDPETEPGLQAEHGEVAALIPLRPSKQPGQSMEGRQDSGTAEHRVPNASSNSSESSTRYHETAGRE